LIRKDLKPPTRQDDISKHGEAALS